MSKQYLLISVLSVEIKHSSFFLFFHCSLSSHPLPSMQHLGFRTGDVSFSNVATNEKNLARNFTCRQIRCGTVIAQTLTVDGIPLNPTNLLTDPGISKYVVRPEPLTGFYTDIQSAYDAARTAGGPALVYIQPGTYVGNVLLDTDQINLLGAGTDLVTIQGTVTIQGIRQVTCQNLTIQGHVLMTNASCIWTTCHFVLTGSQPVSITGIAPAENDPIELIQCRFTTTDTSTVVTLVSVTANAHVRFQTCHFELPVGSEVNPLVLEDAAVSPNTGSYSCRNCILTGGDSLTVATGKPIEILGCQFETCNLVLNEISSTLMTLISNCQFLQGSQSVTSIYVGDTGILLTIQHCYFENQVAGQVIEVNQPTGLLYFFNNVFQHSIYGATMDLGGTVSGSCQVILVQNLFLNTGATNSVLVSGNNYTVTAMSNVFDGPTDYAIDCTGAGCTLDSLGNVTTAAAGSNGFSGGPLTLITF